jgi:hypothetical protein
MVAVLALAVTMADGVWVPGGMRALGFIARGKAKSTPERFVADYCRAIVANAGQPDAGPQYIVRVRSYFERMAALESLGRREGERLTVTLSAADRPGQRLTERVSNLLGWRARAEQSRLVLEVAERTTQSKRKETATALDIDEVGMQEALQAGRPFPLEVRYEKAPVLLGERAWRAAFYPKENLTGGLLEALVRDPRLARLYLALSQLDPRTRDALLQGLELHGLLPFAGLLHRHAAAFGIVEGRASVPGGRPAEPVWAKLAGAGPAEPGRFFRALLEKDQGYLLAFFDALSGFDAAAQAYATRNAAWTERLYAAFRGVPELRTAPGLLRNESSFLETLRRGPRLDDEELLRLARTFHQSRQEKRLLLDAWLAVEKINDRRPERLSEETARLLRERYWEYREAYPYFQRLTALGHPEFQQFFAAADKLRHLPRKQSEIPLGLWHGAVGLLALSEDLRLLDPRDTARRFGLLCEGFAQGGFTNAALDLGRQLPVADLLARRPRSAEVLELQAVPPLNPEDPGPQVLLALAGRLYAYYLDSDDLLVAEDPLLLRKHRFRPDRELFAAADFHPSSEGAGSFLSGGFADMRGVAGQVALAGAKQTDSHSEFVFAAQVGDLRTTDWKRLDDEEVRRVGQRIQAAREWIERSAAQFEERRKLAEATLGLLSFARRAHLLAALEERDWKAVWSVVTLPDLYYLGEPAHRRLLAPYEDYEHLLHPGPIAGRVAELKLFLAHDFARWGRPAAELESVAEPLAQDILRELSMTDLRDWRSVQEALAEAFNNP